MLNAVMGMAPSDREGEPLEEVSRVLLNKWGPSNLTWSTGEIIAPPNGGDGDETDLLGIGEQAVVIGECKAKRLSRSEEHTSELQSRGHLVCRLLLDKKKEA